MTTEGTEPPQLPQPDPDPFLVKPLGGGFFDVDHVVRLLRAEQERSDSLTRDPQFNSGYRIGLNSAVNMIRALAYRVGRKRRASKR